MSEVRIAELSELGMVWNKSRANDWDDCYKHLLAYKAEHGNIDVPADYVANGIWLSKWLNEQKQIFYGKRKGKSLDESQINKLEAAGMDWRSKSERAWDAQYTRLLEHWRNSGSIANHGDKALTLWIIAQRRKYKSGDLTQMQIEKLNTVGMIWDIDDGWETGFDHAKVYAMENGHVRIPSTYVCEDGYCLGRWWGNQRGIYMGKRKYGSLSKQQVVRLESLGMEWDNAHVDQAWMDAFEKYKKFAQTHQTEPKARDKSSGVDLHEWLRTQRMKYRDGKLDAEKVRLLEEIPIDWLFPMERSWEAYFAAAERYYKDNGHLNVPVTYVNGDGMWLGRWVKQMKDKPDKLITTWGNGNKRERLSAIGMEWN